MKNDTSLRNNGTSEVLEEMRTFLSDPWKYLEEPLEQYRKAELLKNRKIYKDTQQQYQDEKQHKTTWNERTLQRKRKEQVTNELADVEPQLQAARDALGSISAKDMNELKNMVVWSLMS